jgi:hypothetical protein
MTVRLIFGLSWSLVAGLAGGWLALSPWALGTQDGGAWTTATWNAVGSGLGLFVLSLAGVVVVIVQTLRALREAGVIGRPRQVADAASPEMERALIALAQALAEDLEAQRAVEHNPLPAAEAMSWGERS